MDLKQYVRDVQDFPISGILFRDITTVLKDPEALAAAIDQMVELVSGIEFDAILGPESRGFIFGVPLAYRLGCGFVPVRKVGKLPAKKRKKIYSLEYGKATIEIHEDAVAKDMRFLLVDDLLATGGTAVATIDLIEEMGAKVAACAFFIELQGLDGRAALQKQDVRSLLKYS